MSRTRTIRRAVLVALLALGPQRALALDPALDVSQYAHTAWRNGERFADGTIGFLAQTADGYLWLGTVAGLLRFDGVRNAASPATLGGLFANERISSLLAGRDGTLWIGTAQGLAAWDGTHLVTDSRLAGSFVGHLLEARDGTIWVMAQEPSGRVLCTIRNGSTDCQSTDLSYLYEAADGAVWAAGASGLERRKDGAVTRYEAPEPLAAGAHMIAETELGTILALTRTGILQLVGARLVPFPVPGAARQILPTKLFRDRDGALWIGTRSNGLLHLHQGRLDVFGRADGLSSDTITYIFEDREGTIWVATDDGLDRFRAFAATAYVPPPGASQAVAAILADAGGGIWFTTNDGLNRWADGRITAYRSRPQPAAAAGPGSGGDEILVEGIPERPASLFLDRRSRLWIGSMTGFGTLEGGRFVAIDGIPGGYVDGIAEDGDGNIWILHRDLGLLRLSSDREVTRFPVSDSAGNPYLRLAWDPVHGGLWLGSYWGGIVHLVEGAPRESYGAADGLGKGTVTQIGVASDGAIWVANAGGLSRIKDGRIATLDSGSGLPCDGVDSWIEDADGAAWLYMRCGLVRIARPALDGWIRAVDQGAAPPKIEMTLFDASDGVRSIQIPHGTFMPQIARDRDGILWFPTNHGIMAIDPRHLPFNPLPPPVHIEQVRADRTDYAPSARLDLPPLSRDLEIDYTALSLVAPEKMRFRYRLEGRDRDWMDAGDRRQAFYTDLAPGDYRFRVIASNNSGVWNEEGASLAFSVAPAYWQTGWFMALCAFIVAGLLAALYRWRLNRLARAALEREAMRLQLAHANRVATMGQLTGSIAHEINQPLAAAITQASAGLRWLRSEPPNLQKVDETFAAIIAANHRAADIVTRIRALVKKAPGEAGAVDLNEEILGVVALTASEASKHAVSLKTELAADVPIINGDRVQLQQLLLNLIVNAIEAMDGLVNGAREVVVRSEADGRGGALVSVRDSGPGIAPGALHDVFEPFYTSKGTGLGLGLSICSSIAEAHGGRLWASANSPRGAIFQFTLPGDRHSAGGS